jgi:uncharacterized protein YfbU (UPF0304 family)
MEFSNEQKLIITLLTDIHAKLDIKNSVDPLFVQRMVNDDQAWALGWAYPGIYENVETPQNVRLVADILEMWEVLEREFSALSVEQKQRLEELAPVFGGDVTFHGFDGNSEYRERSIARILVNDLGRWTRFEGRDLNSHMPSIEGYQRMLQAFENLPEQAKYERSLSVEEIASVVNERTHPSNR